jgi:hypothetical protein
MAMSKSENKILGYSFLTVGALIIIGGLVFGIIRYMGIAQMPTIQGRITDTNRIYIQRMNEVDYGLDLPVLEKIEYVVGGREYSIINQEHRPFEPKIGSTRTIRYDPKNPQRAQVESFFGSYWGPPVIFLEGLVCLFGGLFFLGILPPIRRPKRDSK